MIAKHAAVFVFLFLPFSMAGAQASRTVTAEQKAASQKCGKKVAHPIRLGQWHDPVVMIRGESTSVELDNIQVCSFASRGMDHPQKGIIRFSAARQVRVDDTKVFALKRAEEIRVQKNIAYHTVDGHSLHLDLYRPGRTEAPTPVVLWIHGGGWHKGSKDKCPITWLCEHGFAVASVEYRLTDRAIWPAQMDDCRAAVAFLRSNAAKYGLSATRIGVCGSSAGGHLVAMMGTLDQSDEEQNISGVQAVCNFYGPADLLTMPNNVPAPEKTRDDLASVPGAKLLGGIVSERPEKAKQASPLHQASAGDAPMLILHGDADDTVPLQQSQRLYGRLKDLGVEARLHIEKGAGHGIRQFQSDEIRDLIVDFFNRHLTGEVDNPKVKHLFVAKLLLRKLEIVGITPAQKQAFNQLSMNLTSRITKMRADVGITQAIIKRRDEVYAELKNTDLSGDEFWNALQEQAEITAAQRDVFRETQKHYAKFRANVLALLTDEQRARFPRGKLNRNLGIQKNGPRQDASSDHVVGANTSKPNIVLLFVDDLGWYDLGYRNPKFETPNIDRLAGEGLDFQRAYIASPTCSPSRATLLTGKHPARLQMVRHIPNDPKHGFDPFGRTDEEFNLWEGDPAQFPCRNWLPLEHTSYAEALKELGYYNQFYGKWHLGHEPYHPVKQGFDGQIGTANAGHPKSYYAPFFKNSDVFADVQERYLTDTLTDHAVQFIERYDRPQPFTLSMWYYNVHRPPVGRSDLVEHFKAKGHSDVDAVYAAQVKAVDESVGRIRRTLSTKGIANNTIVVFLSDQGSWYQNLPLRGNKRVDTLCEGGARVPLIVHWPGVTKPKTQNNSLVQSTDLFPTLVELAGGEPSEYPELDGVSLATVLRENSTLDRGEPLFGYRAYQDLYASVREGDWKLLAYRSGKVNLYNIAEDEREENDLAQIHPSKVKQLTAQLVEWERRMNVQQYSGVQ